MQFWLRRPHFCPCCALLGFWASVGTILGSCLSHLGLFYAILGSVSAFVLDLGISVSLNFRPCKAFAKNTINTKEKTQFLGCVADRFCCYFLVVFVSFFCGMLHLSYACLSSRLCWAIGGYVGTILSHVGVFCGLCWPLLGKSWTILGLILGHFGLCWDMLGHVGTIFGSC